MICKRALTRTTQRLLFERTQRTNVLDKYFTKVVSFHRILVCHELLHCDRTQESGLHDVMYCIIIEMQHLSATSLIAHHMIIAAIVYSHG